MDSEKVRLDKYLWSIRLFKTRSLAAEACQNEKVKMNGLVLKPSKTVSIGDKYEIKTKTKKWLIEVSGLLSRRVNFETSLKYYTDLTPEEKKKGIQPPAFYFPTGKRKSKQSRPTKKDKRKLDRFLNQ